MLLGGNVRWKRKTGFPRTKLFSNNTGHVKWHFGLNVHCFKMRQRIFLTDPALVSPGAPDCVLYFTATT